MTPEFLPVDGNWYESLESGESFVVVTVDEDEQVIEIQHRNGDVEEIDFDEWAELDLESISPPEDWQGTYGDMEEEDAHYNVDEVDNDGEWGEPIDLE